MRLTEALALLALLSLLFAGCVIQAKWTVWLASL